MCPRRKPRNKNATSKRGRKDESNNQLIRDGRICDLPDDLIHYILSFMSAREAVRTCILSKRWEHLWSSNPLINLNLSMRRYGYSSSFDDFLNAFMACRDRGAGLANLSLSVRLPSLEQILQNCVADGVNLKTLCIQSRPHDCVVPPAAFLLESLTVFKLRNFVWKPFTTICFPRLRKISLDGVSMNDETLHDLVVNCPSIKTLYVQYSSSLHNFHISSSSLQHVEVYFMNILSFDVKAPNLRSFRCTFVNNPDDLETTYKYDIAFCQALKTLEFNDSCITDVKLEQIVSNLPHLECLVLVRGYRLKHVRIFSESLKILYIDTLTRYTSGFERVDVNAPNLLRITYEGKPLTSFFMKSSHLLEAEIKLRDYRFIRPKRRWFSRLIFFLHRFGHAKLLKLQCSSEALSFPEELRDLPPLKELKNLELHLKPSTHNMTKLIGAVLWFCPSLETLSIHFISTDQCFKVMMI